MKTATLRRGAGRFQAEIAAADHQQPGTWRQPLAQGLRIGQGTDGEYRLALQRRQGARPGAGGDHAMRKAESLAAFGHRLALLRIQARHTGPQDQLYALVREHLLGAQVKTLDLGRPGQESLGQRRPLVGQRILAGQECYRAGETAGAQRHRAFDAGMACADNQYIGSFH